MKKNHNSVNCIYVSRTVLPSHSANSIHLMKISDELYKLCEGNIQVIVNECNCDDKELNRLYGICNKIPVLEINLNTASTMYPYLFAFRVAKYVKKNDIKNIITRDPLTALFLVIMNRSVVLDLHGDLRHLCGRVYHLFKMSYFLKKNNLHIVTITQSLKNYYIENYNKFFDKAIVLADGVTISDYEAICDNDIENTELLTIGYIGKFTNGKGLDTVIKVAQQCSQFRFILCGGTKEEAIEETGLDISENIDFRGYVNNANIPSVIQETNVLMLPNKSDQNCNGEEIGSFTSPLKMFEYMASGRVIIASDIPVLREVLNENNCYFVEEGSIEKWVKKIDYIDTHKAESTIIVNNAKEHVKKYTWNIRANMIIKILVNSDLDYE